MRKVEFKIRNQVVHPAIQGKREIRRKTGSLDDYLYTHFLRMSFQLVNEIS